MNKSINIITPESLADMTLSQFVEYKNMVLNLGDNTDNAFYRCKVVSIFCNLPLSIVRNNIRAHDLQTISDDIVKVLEAKPTYEQEDPLLYFDINGKQFGFIPDFEGMTAGEFADISTYIKEWDTMDRALAVMYRPIINARKRNSIGITQYELEPYVSSDKYREVMLKLPLDKALRASFFLTNSFAILKMYLVDFLSSKISENPKLLTHLKQNLQLSGDGIRDSLSSLKKIL